MNGNRTFTIIKPTAVKNNNIGPILAKINEGGFKIISLKYLKMSEEQAKAFYKVHAERSFYPDLVGYMSSGPVVVAILEKENAVESYRNFIGATNPADAVEGSIRKLFGTSLQANAVHGSDSDENAEIEGNFFFSFTERF